MTNRLLILTLISVLICLSWEGASGVHDGKARRRNQRRKRQVERADSGEGEPTKEEKEAAEAEAAEPEDRMGIAVMTVGAPADEEMGYLDMEQMHETINTAHNEFMVDVKTAMIEAGVDSTDCTFSSRFTNIYKIVDTQTTESKETRRLEGTNGSERSLELKTKEEEMSSGGLTTKELHNMLTGVCYMCSDDNADRDVVFRRQLGKGAIDWGAVGWGEGLGPLTFEDMGAEDSALYKSFVENGNTYSVENIALRTFNFITGPEGREYFKDISCVCITFPFGTEIASHDTTECKNACIDFPVVLDYDPTDEDELAIKAIPKKLKKNSNFWNRLKKAAKKRRQGGRGSRGSQNGKKSGGTSGGKDDSNIFGRKLLRGEGPQTV